MSATIEMLSEWIKDNLDMFYANPAIRSRFLSKPVPKNVRDPKTIIAYRSKGMQKETLYNNMLDFCESILLKRRSRLYTKKIKELRERTSYKVNF